MTTDTTTSWIRLALLAVLFVGLAACQSVATQGPDRIDLDGDDVEWVIPDGEGTS